MKRFITKIIIVIMLLSMGYYLRGIVNDNAEIKEVIVIHGSNDKWEIKDFKVIKYKQRIQRGGGRATYLGDPADLDNLKSFQFEIVKEPIEGKGRTETLYLKSTSSNQGFSIGGEKAFITIGGIDSNKIRYINMEHHESNISEKSNYNFDESHRVRVNVYLKYLNGEKVEDEFYLDTIAMNKETFEKIHMYSEAKQRLRNILDAKNETEINLEEKILLSTISLVTGYIEIVLGHTSKTILFGKG